MAKSWQYGRLRAVALQVVMVIILGGSLGLAAFLDRRHSSALNVQLGPPRAEGRLGVRLPKDWDVDAKQTSEGPPRTLTAIDYDRQGRARRTLRITQEQQQGRPKGAEFYLEGMMSSQHVIPLQPQSFPMLGQDDAVLVPFKADFRNLPEAAELDLPEPGLYACAVMPDGLAVTVQVVGEGAYGPSAYQLLRLVADNLKLADSPSARPPSR